MLAIWNWPMLSFLRSINQATQSTGSLTKKELLCPKKGEYDSIFFVRYLCADSFL